MIDKFVQAAGQGDAAATGSELNPVTPAPASATGGAVSSGSASLGGTTVQMGAAGGLVFNITYDSSVGSAPAGFTSAISAVVSYYESVFNDPITVNIDVGWGEVAGQALGSGALGESETNLGLFSYSQVKMALAADAKSADDSTAVNNLPGSDPTGGGSFPLTTADAKALGLGTSASVDGYVGFSSSANYTFDPSNRAVSGAYDFIGVAEHEISEVMGRIALLGTPLGGLSRTYTALDLFRYFEPRRPAIGGRKRRLFLARWRQYQPEQFQPSLQWRRGRLGERRRKRFLQCFGRQRGHRTGRRQRSARHGRDRLGPRHGEDRHPAGGDANQLYHHREPRADFRRGLAVHRERPGR
jgi:hypothetical protein